MTSFKTYVQAARLRTLPLSISGIVTGSFLAYADGFSNWKIVVLALITTVGFQILSNFANDYGDGVKGTDNDERVGPKRSLQSGDITQKQLKKTIIITAIVTLLFALTLIFEAFATEKPLYTLVFFLLGMASIVAAIKYTIGNKAYGYSGFGDLFVFVFFGLLSVVGSYFLFTKQLNWTIFMPAVSIGLLSVGVLHLNNMRDSESDKKSNKLTTAVKLGELKSKKYYFYIISFSFLFAVIFVTNQYHVVWQFLFVLAYIPIVKQLIRILKNRNPKALDPELKILALSTFLFAFLFGFGQIL